MADPVSNEVLAVMLNNQTERIGRVEGVLGDISTTMKEMVKLEARQDEHGRAIERAFGMVNDQDVRIKVLEKDTPGLKDLRKWTIAAVAALLSAVVYGFFSGSVHIAIGRV